MNARGHKHAEAFALMNYASDDGTERERIWNSRDGITPFVISSRTGKMMSHVDWDKDAYAPEHKPKPGDRIFVKLTPERARELVTRNVEKTIMQYGLPDGFTTREEYVEHRVKAAVEGWGGDSPDLVEVRADGTWL